MSFTHSIEIQNGKMAIAKVVTEDGELFSAVAGQPNFDLICSALLGNPDESVLDLFDVERAVEAAFRRITERVTVKNRTVFYDGDVLHNGVSKQILRLVEEGDLDNLQSVANFTERVMTNPQEHSRDQLFTWLERHKFTITPEGLIVMYKGCRNNDGTPVSSRMAPASDGVLRNDEPVVDDFVKNLPGDVITMPRSGVDFNAYVGCSIGLHAGTYAYAKSFAPVLLEVHVDPRDVVSVPTDCDAQKVRVCRYTVIGPVDEEYAEAVLPRAQVEEPVDEVDDEFTENEITVGDRVKCNRSLYGAGGETKGQTATVTQVLSHDYSVRWDNRNLNDDSWLKKHFDKIDGKAQKWDTRQNYSKQKRYPAGTYKNGKSVAGRFIPRDSPDYSNY